MSSIQEYLKRINSKLTKLNCLSLFATAFCCLSFTGYLYLEKAGNNTPVSYIEGKFEKETSPATDSRPFASIKGKTYTFTWCQNSGAIKKRVYFTSEEEAKMSGRVLSKLCQK